MGKIISRYSGEEAMSETVKVGHSRDDFEVCVKYARDHGYWAMLNSMVGDGYSPDVNWRALMKEKP